MHVAHSQMAITAHNITSVAFKTATFKRQLLLEGNMAGADIIDA
jgi:hypothetical protein